MTTVAVGGGEATFGTVAEVLSMDGPVGIGLGSVTGDTYTGGYTAGTLSKSWREEILARRVNWEMKKL